MKSRIAVRGFSVLVLAISIVVSVYGSLLRAQDKPAATQASAKIVLTTDPSPAQKGSNTIHLKLTDSAGKPIVGAKVTITFFMAAMPAMNMPEMKTVIQGMDMGGGMYEGKGELGSGGNWQVTVMAQQGGKTIANKKLTVKATGGA